MKQPKVTIRVNDDAPADLALGTTKLVASSYYDIERRHLPALADYVTEVEADAKADAAAPAKTAAKKGRK